MCKSILHSVRDLANSTCLCRFETGKRIGDVEVMNYERIGDVEVMSYEVQSANHRYAHTKWGKTKQPVIWTDNS
jgi:hypothetical protein